MISGYMKVAAVAVTLSMGWGATSADALSMYDGTYEATSVNTGGNLHTIWLPGIFGGNTVNNYWQFIDDSGKLMSDGAAGTINVSGIIENNSVSGYQFDVDLDFAYRANYDDYIGGGTGLNGPKTVGGPVNDTWEFYNMTGGVLTGLGDLMGLTLTLTQYPDINQAFQIGEDANDKNEGLGASVWFNWVAEIDQSKYTGPMVYNSGTSPAGAHGDLNLNLTPVPLPAAGWMLLAGLSGLGAMRRRRKQS